jgi:TRAP-type C4-dicarboxylate transport system permease small subunit
MKKLRFRTLEDFLDVLAMICVMVIMLMTAIDVAGRYFGGFFGKSLPIPGTVEILALVMALVVFLSLPGSQRQEQHIGMDLFLDRFKGRTYRIIQFVNLLLPLFAFAIIGIYSFINALRALEVGWSTTGMLGIPTAPFRFVIAFGSLMICIRFAFQIFQLRKRNSNTETKIQADEEAV